MKPNLTLVLFGIIMLTVIYTRSCSQGSSTVVMDLGNPPSITYGSNFKKGFIERDMPFYILVKNYNPIRYRITVSSTGVVTYQSTSNSLINYVNTDATITTSTTNKVSAIATGFTKPTPAEAMAKPKLDQSVKDLDALKKNVKDIIGLLNGNVSALSDYYSQLNAFQAEYEKWKLKTTLNEATVRNFRQAVYNNMAGTIIQVYTDHATAVNPYGNTIGSPPNYNINSIILIGFPSKALDLMKADLTDFQKALDNLDVFEKANHADIARISQLVKIPDFTAFRKDLTSIQAVYQKFINDYDQNYGKYLTPLATILSTSESLEFQTYFGPYTMEGNDEKTIKVAKLNILNSNDDELKDNVGILIKRQGGIKIDFSAGLFFSNLSDRSYVSSASTRITQDSIVNNGSVTVGPHQTTFSKIIQRGGSNLSYGPMAFIHFHDMNASILHYGLYLGTGFLFKDNAKPVVSVGGNLMLASFQRLILGFGAAFGSVTRLSSQYQINQSYPVTITDVPTESHLEVKGLVSLSWNLSK